MGPFYIPIQTTTTKMGLLHIFSMQSQHKYVLKFNATPSTKSMTKLLKDAKNICKSR